MAGKNNSVSELRKLLAGKLLVFGTDRTLKELKKGRVAKVFLASNCGEETKETIKRYCSLSKVFVDEVKEDDAEIGVICKKQFSISVVSVLKGK